MNGRLIKDNKMWGYGLNSLYPDIFCFSTTRHGGVSQGDYASMNVNPWTGDEPEHVKENQRLLLEELPAQPSLWVMPHQTHSTNVKVIRESVGNGLITPEDTDAVVTHLPNTLLTISTADCIPVLLYDRVTGAIAAIHAGWRGTVNHIVTQTLQVMQREYGTQGKNLTACIGPGISLDAFEVGDEVYEAFRAADFPMERMAERRTKWHLDLWEANRLQLLEYGVPATQIEVAGICTYTRHEEFFSARRAGIHSGRICTGILRIENRE